MPEGDDPMEGSLSSPVLGSVESKQSEDVLSPEDVAWADSCLIKDSEISHRDLNSLTEALLETLGSLPDSFDFSGVEIQAFPAETATEIVPMNEEAESSQYLDRSVADIVPINEEEESNNDHTMHDETDASGEITSLVNGYHTMHDESDASGEITSLVNGYLPRFKDDLKKIKKANYVADVVPINKEEESNNDHIMHDETDASVEITSLVNGFLPRFNEELKKIENADYVGNMVPINKEEESNNDHMIPEEIDASREITNLANVFLPRYNEDLKKVDNVADEVDSGFRVSEVEPSTDDIFRVWDLDIPDEEDEFLEKLNKALAGSSLQPTPSTFDDSGVLKDLKEESLEDLISGIAELSLKNFG